MTVEDVARKMLELKILPRFCILVMTGVSSVASNGHCHSLILPHNKLVS